MAVQYWVGDFFVDLSRNQITGNKQSQTIAPKALAVLTCLAENQGQVVSQEALLGEVWQDTTVTPNTLQRSIAQLRRALGDNGKDQRYIKTHAKQGYSLECDVRWHSSETNHTSSEVTKPNSLKRETISGTNEKTNTLRWFFIVAGLIFVGVLVNHFLSPKKTTQLTFDAVRLLTATDDKEFDATYSVDGEYIVFHRYLEKQCINKLWAKNTRTQQEVPLTKDWANYGRHSFSRDGKKLVFLATEACTDSQTQRDCFDLVSLDFEKALESPQQPSLMLRCENSNLSKPLWISDDHIAIMQRKATRWKLIQYSLSQNQCTDLYEVEAGNIIDYAYSTRDDLIAVTRFNQDGRQVLDLLRPDGHILSSHQIKLPPEIPTFRPIFPNFAPQDGQLIFSTGKQLFTLSYEGDVTKISLPFADKMVQPEFHPNGKSLLMLKGPYDSDITSLSLDVLAATQLPSATGQSPVYPSFERSNLGEDYGLFQPGGDLIAFWSERSGEEQLWISDGNGPLQLTQFPMDTTIRGIAWAKDGQSLLVNANYALTQVHLDSSQKSFPFEHPVVILFQWDSEDNSALFLARIGGLLKVVIYDLDTLEIREVNDKKVLWAKKTNDGRIIYKDYNGRFWQPGPIEDQRIKALDNQRGKSKSFVMKDDVIYAINRENQLWSYDLQSETFKILGTVSQAADSLTDVHLDQYLITFQVSAKKEVVELILSE